MNIARLFRIFLYLAVFVLAARFLLPWIVFHPIREIWWTPEKSGINFENVFFESGGLKLNAWFVPAQNSRGTIFFFHGNGGNISHRSESIKIFLSLRMSVFIFDYRGYGESEGTPSIDGVNRDALAAWEWLSRKKGEKNVIVFGRSLGGAVALEFIKNASPNIRGLILESTFSSLSDMVGFDFLSSVARVLISGAWQSVETARTITVPTLCIHSPDDDIVQYRLGRRLFDALSSPKKFVDIKGDHNSGFIESIPRYAEELDSFLSEILVIGGTRDI